MTAASSSLKTVFSFRTTDGELHEDKTEALMHQAKIDLRGLMQSNTLGRIGNIQPADVANFILCHGEEVQKILSDLKTNLRRAVKKN